MNNTSTRMRYAIGRTVNLLLDQCVLRGALPLRSRFPLGIHLEYDLRRFLGAPKVIVDAGANRGDTAVRFARFFVDAIVHAFEPVPVTFDILKARVGINDRIACVPFALGSCERKLRIALEEDSELNSLLNESTASNMKTAEVRVLTLDGYAEENSVSSVDLLKIDTEGYEMQVLAGSERLLTRRAIKAIFAECGFVKTDVCKTPFSSLDNFLVQRGFRFSGFYQLFRWGPQKRWAGFANGLWLLNENAVQRPDVCSS